MMVCLLVCMCLPPRLLITSGMMWGDMDPYDWLNKFFSYYYMTRIGSILKRCGLGIYIRHESNSIRIS